LLVVVVTAGNQLQVINVARDKEIMSTRLISRRLKVGPSLFPKYALDVNRNSVMNPYQNTNYRNYELLLKTVPPLSLN
jgi:hypothetical protein